MAASSAATSPNGDEARRVRAEAAPGARVVGEADDRGGPAVEVAGGDDDLRPAVRHPFDVVAPLPRHLDARLDRLRAGVHRQHHLLADQGGQVGGEGPQLVVVERPGGEGDAVQLLLGRGDQHRVAVAEVGRRVGGQEVQVGPAVGVGDRRPGRGGDDHLERVVVVYDVAVLDRQQVGGAELGCRGEDRVGHGWLLSGPGSARVGSATCRRTSWVQHLTLPPPLTSSPRSTGTGA